MLPCPVRGVGAERAQPARGDRGRVFSLQRLPHRSRDLGAHLPAGPHERRLLGTPCVATGRVLKGGCSRAGAHAFSSKLVYCARCCAKAGLPDFDGCRRAPWPKIDANTCPHLRHCVGPRPGSGNSDRGTWFVRPVDMFRSSGFLRGKAGSCGWGRAPGVLRGSSFSGPFVWKWRWG